MCGDGPAIRQHDRTVHIQLDLQAQSSSLPDHALESFEGCVSSGDSVQYFLVDVDEARQGITEEDGLVCHEALTVEPDEGLLVKGLLEMAGAGLQSSLRR